MLLSIQDLKVAFRMGKTNGVMQRQLAVKGVSFDIPENGTVALVGESGSGKSVTAMSILNLLPDNAERTGQILFQGRDLLAAASNNDAARVRERRLGSHRTGQRRASRPTPDRSYPARTMKTQETGHF